MAGRRKRFFARHTAIAEGIVIEDEWIVDRRSGATARLVPLGAVHLLGPHLVDDVMAAATVGVDGRRRAGGDDGGGRRVSTASSTRWSSSPRSTACGSSTIRRRPTSNRRCGRSRASIAVSCRSSAAGSRAAICGLLREPLGCARDSRGRDWRSAGRSSARRWPAPWTCTTPGRSRKRSRWPTRWHRPAGVVLLAPACASFDMFQRLRGTRTALQGGGGTDRGARWEPARLTLNGLPAGALRARRSLRSLA